MNHIDQLIITFGGKLLSKIPLYNYFIFGYPIGKIIILLFVASVLESIIVNGKKK